MTIRICYGSQTGTAFAFAQDLRDDAAAKGITAEVIDLEDFEVDAFRQCASPVLLIVANTGDGEPTDNAVAFHKWLMDPKTPEDALSGVPFAVFGLGDRTYLHFNRAAIQMDEGMSRLGGLRVHPLGLGDDSSDLLADFQSWKDGGLWAALRRAAGPETGAGPPQEAAEVADDLEVVLGSDACAARPSETNGDREEASDVISRFYFHGIRSRVLAVRELRQQPRPEEGQSTAHVELDTAGHPELSAYCAAGTLEMLPENAHEEVAKLLPLFGLTEAHLDSQLGFRQRAPQVGKGQVARRPFPTPCTLRDALSFYCDLRRPPSRRMLGAMAPRLPARARECVKRLLADASAWRVLQDEALGWTQAEFWFALLGPASCGELKLGAFLLHCPRQRPRSYTIASSPSASPGRVHVCASLVTCPVAASLADAVGELVAAGALLRGTRAPAREPGALRSGVCSRWLCGRLQPGREVLVRVRGSGFKLTEADVPIVMVGAGAGVAPFRAFWGEMAAEAARGRRRSAPVALFFGCRRPDEDWLYRSEMEEAASRVFSGVPPLSDDTKSDRPISEVHIAFSRHPGGGRYVQDALHGRAEKLRSWLVAKGVFYICGSTRMGQDVLAALAEILDGGKAAVDALRAEERLIVEFWGDSVPQPPPAAPAPEAPSPAAFSPPRRAPEGLATDLAALPPPPDAVRQLIESRRSVFPKDYTGGAVPDELVQRLLSASRWAPTHGKTEPWRFVVYAGEARHQLIDATLAHYRARDAGFWKEAWGGEFAGFEAFEQHVEKQRREKWLRCSNLVSICMKRQQPQEGKRLFPEHEEVAAAACAVQNMHLVATSLSIAAYWSSWFEHFTGSPDGLELHDLDRSAGDLWLGVFCIGQSERIGGYRSSRRRVEDIAEWRGSCAPDAAAAAPPEPSVEPLPTKARRRKRTVAKVLLLNCFGIRERPPQLGSTDQLPALCFAPHDESPASASAVERLVEARRSIFPKDYTGEEVPGGIVCELLSAARWAPTHGKTEPWRFVVFSGEARHRLIDATLGYYADRPADFWRQAWGGEFPGFEAFEAHVERQRREKWLRCSHLIGICMKRQTPEAGKRQFPEREEVAAVACAVQNLHLLAASMRLGAYWSSWFEHFTHSGEGVRFHGLRPERGDRWLGVFCVGVCAPSKLDAYRSSRRPVEEIASWRRSRARA